MTKVKLTRLVVDDGNPYHPGVYEENYLPKAFFSRPGLIENVEQEKTVGGNYQNSIKTQEIKLTPSKTIEEQTSYNPAETIVVNTKKPKKVAEEIKQAASTSKTDVNSATLAELENLALIGTVTANKIIEAREKKAFANFDDLKSRVELPRGDWNQIADDLSFEGKKK